MHDKNIHRFRFATDGGDAYAVAVLGDKEQPRVWRVGFAFKSPLDGRNMRPTKVEVNGDKVKKKFDLGYLIAENRARKYVGKLAVAFPMSHGAESARDDLSAWLVERILLALPPYTDASIPLSQAFGIRPYLGLGKGDFGKWVLGPFAEQFRTRYAPGGES